MGRICDNVMREEMIEDGDHGVKKIAKSAKWGSDLLTEDIIYVFIKLEARIINILIYSTH